MAIRYLLDEHLSPTYRSHRILTTKAYDLTVLLLPNFVQSIDTYQTELYILKNRIEKLIKLNNLKEA
ncbi:hypothetical protein [Nostoc sp.]|uniref:hypothetical protein n=1 Tax=Nostoc sp. TaxID=1180 RepID=UPI002FFC94CD